MGDVSDNEEEVIETVEESEVDSEESEVISDLEKVEGEEVKHEIPESVTLVDSVSYDYTSNFENLQTIGIFLIAVIVAQTLVLSFVLGFKGRK